jgi:hypothetical protein
MVVVAMVDDLALVVEAKHGYTRVGELLSVFSPGPPPLNRGAVPINDRNAEPTLDVVLPVMALTEIPQSRSPKFLTPESTVEGFWL